MSRPSQPYRWGTQSLPALSSRSNCSLPCHFLQCSCQEPPYRWHLIVTIHSGCQHALNTTVVGSAAPAGAHPRLQGCAVAQLTPAGQAAGGAAQHGQVWQHPPAAGGVL